MYTLNILNYFTLAILATDAVSFAFKPTGEYPHHLQTLLACNLLSWF
jgi:hypothetical protein